MQPRFRKILALDIRIAEQKVGLHSLGSDEGLRQLIEAGTSSPLQAERGVLQNHSLKAASV
jgi:hypothetical protein